MAHACVAGDLVQFVRQIWLKRINGLTPFTLKTTVLVEHKWQTLNKLEKHTSATSAEDAGVLDALKPASNAGRALRMLTSCRLSLAENNRGLYSYSLLAMRLTCLAIPTT
jgi:hypothetical protein